MTDPNEKVEPLEPGIAPTSKTPSAYTPKTSPKEYAAHAIRVATLAGVVLLIFATIGFSVVTFITTRSDLDHSTHILKLVNGAVGPKATQASNAETVKLVDCVGWLVGYDDHLPGYTYRADCAAFFGLPASAAK